MNSELKNKRVSDEKEVELALDTVEEIDAIAELAFDYGIEGTCDLGELRKKLDLAVIAGDMEPSVALRLYCWYAGIGNGYVVKAAELFADFDEYEAAEAQLDATFQRRDISEVLDYLDFQASR